MARRTRGLFDFALVCLAKHWHPFVVQCLRCSTCTVMHHYFSRRTPARGTSRRLDHARIFFNCLLHRFPWQFSESGPFPRVSPSFRYAPQPSNWTHCGSQSYRYDVWVASGTGRHRRRAESAHPLRCARTCTLRALRKRVWKGWKETRTKERARGRKKDHGSGQWNAHLCPFRTRRCTVRAMDRKILVSEVRANNFRNFVAIGRTLGYG